MKSTDDFGESVEKHFEITINDVPEPPSDIYFVHYVVAEYSPIGTVIGKFLVHDEDHFRQRLLSDYWFEFCSGNEGN